MDVTSLTVLILFIVYLLHWWVYHRKIRVGIYKIPRPGSGQQDSALPTKGSEHASCFDVYAVQQVTISPGKKQYVPTGIIANLPPNVSIHIHPRSSQRKRDISTLGVGIIDGDYRGELGVLLFNHGDISYTVLPGDKVGQLEFQKVLDVKLFNDDKIVATKRGDKGWGSTNR
jgi:dUTP pyrophosphatase